MRKHICGEALLPFIRHALSGTVDPDGAVHAERFTERQRSRYAFDSNKLNGDFVLPARAGSGICLALQTDSAIIGLRFRWLPCIRETDHATFDLLLDGRLWDSAVITSPTAFEIGFPLPEGEHEVRLVFPWNAEIRVCELILSEGAEAVPAKEKSVRILSLGDSITQGYLAEHPSMTYTGILARKMNAELLNQGVGGYYFEKASLDPALARFAPTLITVAYGHNDYVFRPEKEALLSGMADYLDALTAIFPHTPILGVLPIYCASANARTRDCIRDFSEQEAYAGMKSLYERYPQVTVLEDDFFPHHPDFFAVDRLHPNDAGFLIYGQKIAEIAKNR